MTIELVSQDALDRFKSIAKIDIRQYFQDYTDFIDQHYPSMVEYYSGTTSVVDSEAFSTFDDLEKRTKELIDQFISNELSLGSYEYWTMLEFVEDIQFQLETTANLAKWLRSNRSNTGFITSPRIPYVAKQGESLEDISSSEIGSANPEEDWVDTALKNDLKEEDYTLDGGYLIKIDFKNNDSIILQSVVDTVDTVEKSFGLDIDRNFKIVDNDIKTLGHKETLMQSADIAANLKKGDNPVAPNDGIDTKRGLGVTSAGFSYPIVFRAMAQVFAKDDTFKSFTILDVRKDKDAVFVDFRLQTRAGDINKSIQI